MRGKSLGGLLTKPQVYLCFNETNILCNRNIISTFLLSILLMVSWAEKEGKGRIDRIERIVLIHANNRWGRKTTQTLTYQRRFQTPFIHNKSQVLLTYSRHE